MAGCEFNRQLEIDKYIENKEAHGERFARQYLKTNMAHYRAKENGQPVPEWDVRLAHDGLVTGGGDDLLQLTGQPLTSHLSGQVSDEIKVRVPIEMETVRHANDLAKSGADVILMPEHVTENGILRVRFVTIYTKDSIDSNLYHGSQIDLGQSITPEEAKMRMQQMTENFSLIRPVQSNVHKDAFAFGIEKVSHGDEESLSDRLRDFSKRETVGQHVPVVAYEKPILQHRSHIREPNDSTIQDATLTTRASIAETSTTARMTGKYFIDRLAKIRKKKLEMSKNEANRRKYKQEIKLRGKTDRIIPTIQKRHTEMKRAKNTLVIIHETGVGIGAIPLLISVLTRELPAPVRAMEKSIKRHKKKEIRLKNHEVRKRKQDTRSDVKEGQSFKIEHKGRKKRRKTHKEVLTSDNKHIPKERKALRKRKRKIGVGEKTGKKSAVVDRLTVFTFKKEKQLNKNRMRRKAGKVEQVMEFKRLSKREKKLWRLVTGFARRMEHQRKEMNRTPYRITKSESVKRTKTREVARRETVFRKTRKESKEAINNFFFALFFWVLLKHFEKQMQTHVTEKPQETRKEENLPVSQEIGQNQRQENLIVKEPAPWILLSVIWYLVMAREGGLVKMPNANPPAGGPMPNKKSGKKKRFKKKQFFQTSSIPKHAVIFAFNS